MSVKGLTKRQALFAAEYLTDLNATRSAIAAGYSKKGAEQTGSVLLRNPKVADYIEVKLGKRMGKLEITADRDDVPPVPVEPVSKLGDLYIMGDHLRIVTGIY